MACCNSQVGAVDPAAAPTLAKMGTVARHCDVCLILDGNRSPKEVQYCKLCDKWMCEPCRKSPFRRALAMFSYKLKSKLTPIGS